MLFHVTAGGPRPVAPFGHAVATDGLVFVTGQMADTPGVLHEGVVPQTRAVMADLPAGVGLGFEHAVMGRVHQTASKRDDAVINDACRACFSPDRRPARTCVGGRARLRPLPMKAECFCIHSDTPTAVPLAKAVRDALRPWLAAA